MNHKHGAIIVAVLILALALAGTALAKEVVQITISGPGLKGEVEVTNQQDFEDIRNMMLPIQLDGPPESIGAEFYTLRFGIGDDKGEVFATNVYHYYPDPEGGLGFVLFADVEGGEASVEGQWFRIDAASDQGIKRALNGFGVTLAVEAEAPVVEPQSQPESNPAVVKAESEPVEEVSQPSGASAPESATTLAPSGQPNLVLWAAAGAALLLVAGIVALSIRRRVTA